MWGLPQKQNARRADKIRLCGHLRRYKKIVKKIYIIYENNNKVFMLNVMVNKVVLNIRVHVYKFSKGDGDDVKRNKSK